MMKTESSRQIVKYGLIGILNTLLTTVVIWSLLYILMDESNNEPTYAVMFIANFVGYLVGIINSFILNRNWTFKNKSNWKVSLLRFLIAFVLCYCLQLGVVLGLNSIWGAREYEIGFNQYSFTLTSAYFSQLIGIVVYSILNFLLNKYYTFRSEIQCNDMVRNKKQHFITIIK